MVSTAQLCYCTQPGTLTPPFKTDHLKYVTWAEYPHNFAAVLNQLLTPPVQTDFQKYVTWGEYSRNFSAVLDQVLTPLCQD